MQARRGGWRSTFAGLTWKGLGLVALVSLANATRRVSPYFWGEATSGELLLIGASHFGTSLIIALTVTLAVVATYNLVSADPKRRYPAIAAAVILSSGAGTLMLIALEPSNWSELLAAPVRYISGIWGRYLMFSGLFTAVYVYLRNADESLARAREVEVDRDRLDQQMDEARLQVLQAQIEPHFLFNTLSTLRRLYRSAPGPAAEMLDNLMRYLTVALPQMRTSGSTLGREAELARSYLAIQKIRMGSRLAYDIDIPERLDNARVPPMMLLTLVENAIKHGLDPLPEGGFIRVSASTETDRLRLEVGDSGRGFVTSTGAGTGLANIRARLAAEFGPRGKLDLSQNRPRGITATLVFPRMSSTAGVAS
jgi:hypothetical protein